MVSSDVGARRPPGAHGVPHLAAPGRVQAGGRLVEQQQTRGPDQAGAEVQPAALAARVGAAAPVRHLAQAELVDDGGGGPRPAALAVPEEPGGHLQVLPARHGRLDGGELSGQADDAAHGQRVA